MKTPTLLYSFDFSTFNQTLPDAFRLNQVECAEKELMKEDGLKDGRGNIKRVTG